MARPNTGASLTVEGDSITFGTGAATPAGSWPQQLLALYTRCEIAVFANVATSGAKIPDFTTDAAGQVTPKYDAARRCVLVVFGGTNDIANVTRITGAETYALLVTYCQARRSSGFKVVVVTCLPRTGFAGFYDERLAYNTLIRANWSTFADGLADVAADSRIGDDGDQLDGTYYGDQVHMTNAGYAVVAGIVKTAVDTLL